jgi:hypothetical protein
VADPKSRSVEAFGHLVVSTSSSPTSVRHLLNQFAVVGLVEFRKAPVTSRRGDIVASPVKSATVPGAARPPWERITRNSAFKPASARPRIEALQEAAQACAGSIASAVGSALALSCDLSTSANALLPGPRWQRTSADTYRREVSERHIKMGRRRQGARVLCPR